MTPGQALDWLAETRLPHHAHLWAARAARFPTPVTTNAPASPVEFGLTVDVEQDFGSRGFPDQWSACAPFLEWLHERAPGHWRPTLYVQGSVAEPLAIALRAVAPRCEIGLHGHLHELWGRELWFTPQRGTSVPLRRERLRDGLRSFDRAGLERPRNFRAPNLVCDDATLDILEEHQFTHDSSAPAFRGALPIPAHRGSMRRLPVSAAPRPRVRRRFGLPTWATFPMLNLANLLDSDAARLGLVVGQILDAQRILGAPRHVVVLTHPWEFADIGAPGCASDNLARLVGRIEWLESTYAIAHRTLSEIGSRSDNLAESRRGG